jgi:hypothetical protein
MPGDLLARIDAEIEKNNERRTEEPYDRASWIRQAIEERLLHLERSRHQPSRKRKAR